MARISSSEPGVSAAVVTPTPAARPSTAPAGLVRGRRDTPAGAFALGICGSAIVYIMTFLTVGVATDFRYAYWGVLAGLNGAVAIAARRA